MSEAGKGDGAYFISAGGTGHTRQGTCRRRGRHQAGTGFDLGDYVVGHSGPDDVAAVVLTADPAESFHVDGVRNANGRLQFGVPDDVVGSSSHFGGHAPVTGIMIRFPTASPSSARGSRLADRPVLLYITLCGGVRHGDANR